VTGLRGLRPGNRRAPRSYFAALALLALVSGCGGNGGGGGY